jgi:hypothetical protein
MDAATYQMSPGRHSQLMGAATSTQAAIAIADPVDRLGTVFGGDSDEAGDPCGHRLLTGSRRNAAEEAEHCSWRAIGRL